MPAIPAMEQKAMSDILDERPKRKISHEIGQDLSALSVDELEQRIGVLEVEIDRLRAEIAAKTATRNAAEQLFKSR